MESIRIEAHGDVALATMTHGKANTLDIEMCEMVIRTLRDLAGGDARAVVITGTGSIFSAGVDLLRFDQDGPEYREQFVPLVSALVHALFNFPKPLVAAVNGHAAAGGCVMACTADRRIMARGSGRIGVPELLVGLPFPTAALEMVRYVVPANHVQAVIYGGATYLPDDALRVGLVDELVDADVLVEHAVSVAEQLARIAPDVFALTKRQLRAATVARIAAGAERDIEGHRIWTDAAALGRIRDYVERTFKPR
jgi:enoyl-CoA hydratase